jgi:hypothetical protein
MPGEAPASLTFRGRTFTAQFEPLELALVDAHNGGDSVPVGAQLR